MTLAHHEKSQVVLASAGTGKTFRLTMRYIALLAKGYDPARILVTTFTRAAAGELADRILRMVARAALPEGTDTLELLRRHAHKNLTAERCAELARALANSLHRLHIQTIDSFFARCATGFALELDLPPGWRMLEDSEDTSLRDEAVEQVVHQSGGEAVIALLEAVSAGKAESRVAHPLRNAVNSAYTAWQQTHPEAWWTSPHHPFDLSRSEIAHILKELDDYPCPRTKAGKENVRWKNALARVRTLIADGPIEDLAIDSLAGKSRYPEPTFDRIPIDPMLIEILQPAVQCAEHKHLWRITRRNQGVCEFLQHFDEQYRSLKRRVGGVVFDDIPRMLLDSHAMDHLATLAYRIDGAIDHIMIDEAQDTSIQQFELLQEVIDEILATGGVGDRTVCIVGDVKQSLYGWRNAEPELLASLPQRWPQIEVDSMALSYRSSPVIMQTVNKVFQSLADNEALQDNAESAGRWSALFREHDTTLKALPGYAALIEAPKGTTNSEEDEDLPDTLRATDRIAIDRIRSLHEQAPHLTIGILYRSNKYIAPMVHALRARGVPACESRGNPLTDTPVVAAVLSLLLLSEHPGYTAAAYHIAQTPLAEIVDLPDHSDRKAIAKMGDQWRKRITRLGYAETLRSLTTDLAPHTDARGMERFAHLIEIAERADNTGSIRALDFLDMVENTPFESSASEPVRVMTIHASKGLEFDAVILPELDARWSLRSGEMASLKPNIFDPVKALSLYVPADLREFDPDLEAIFHDEEGRRIRDGLCALYVAMTRARCALEMIVTPAPKNSTSIHAHRVLRAALAPDPPPAEDDDADHRVLWSEGDPDWHSRLERTSATPPDRQTPRTIRFATKPAKSWIRNTTAPSSLEGSGVRRADALLQPRPVRALDYGTLIHHWLSEIEWLDVDKTTTDTLLASAQSSDLDATHEDAQRFLEHLSMPTLRAALSIDRPHPDRRQGDRLVVRREYPFVRADRRDRTPALMTGVIDRLVIGLRDSKPAWAEVIDFKTDAISPSDAELLKERAEYYRPQLEAYRTAAAEILKLPEDAVRCKLIFINAKAEVDPFEISA